MNATRYQESPWWVRLWRRRWYLMSPVWAIPVWRHENTRPDRFVPKPDGTLFKVPRWSLRQCFRLGVSMAQSRMNWVYSLDDVI